MARVRFLGWPPGAEDSGRRFDMCTDQEAMRARRQRIWADLAYLEKMMLRHDSIFDNVPQHWQRARELLWRDLRAMTTPTCTGSAQRLLGQVQRLTINGPEIEGRIEKMLAGHKALVTSAYVVDAMRNLGKPEGKEIAVGNPTEPMDNLGYPDGWTKMVRG